MYYLKLFVKAEKYKIEPYIIPADIYGSENLIGRGGWSWYTGSSSWYYIAGIENILGLKIENQNLSLNPCVPKEWKECEIRYKWKNSIYNIKIKNSKVSRVTLNENPVSVDTIEW